MQCKLELDHIVKVQRIEILRVSISLVQMNISKRVHADRRKYEGTSSSQLSFVANKETVCEGSRSDIIDLHIGIIHMCITHMHDLLHPLLPCKY